MNKIFYTAILSLVFLSVNALSQGKTFFQTVEGKWQGTLEYLDYSDGKSRVSLKTIITFKTSADGNSAEVSTVYDDFGKIIKDQDVEKIDAAAKKYFEDKTEFTIESIADGKIVLLGSGQDGEKVEPIRKTITYSNDTLTILKETKTPLAVSARLYFEARCRKQSADECSFTAAVTGRFRRFQRNFNDDSSGNLSLQHTRKFGKRFHGIVRKTRSTDG